MENQQVKTEITKQVTLASLYKKGLWKTVSNLKKNSNNLYFVTLLNKKNRAANLYFGRKTSLLLDANFNVGDNVIGFLADSTVIMSQTKEQEASGEYRFKLSRSGATDYNSQASIEQAFGIENSNDEFDYELFNKEFYKSDLVEKEQFQESIAQSSN